MISTGKFQVTKRDFFNIRLTVYLRRAWWALLILIAVVVLIALHKERDDSESFVMNLFILILFARPIKLWKFAHPKSNNIFLLKRHVVIFDDKIMEELEDGTSFTIKTDHFIKAFQTRKFHLLFYTKEQFISIPKDSFRSEQDKAWFEEKLPLY